MQPPKIASREHWLAARKWLLGGELLLGAFNWLDLTPKGRNETGTMSWVRRHDEYDKGHGEAADCCHSAAGSR